MQLFMVSIPVHDPVKAHEIYTTKLGFISVEFNADSNIAVVTSPEDPNGPTILLEPCKGTFYESFQQSAYNANLPIIIFKTKDLRVEIERLKKSGVTFRKELDKPEYGLVNLFEDGCGNLLMLQE